MPRSMELLPIRSSVSIARTLWVSPPTLRLNEVVTTGVPMEVVVVVGDMEVAPLEEVEGEVVDTPLTLLIGKERQGHISILNNFLFSPLSLSPQ